MVIRTAVLSPHSLQPKQSCALLDSDFFRTTIWAPLGSTVRTILNHNPNSGFVTCALFWAEMLGADSNLTTGL
jgi:hypothetical protein